MESSDQYHFSIFRPRNLHGKKNRNVIFSMLIIWAVAVFGFQVLLRIIEKPTPEESLTMFESTWSSVHSGDLKNADYKTFLKSLVLVRGKNTLKTDDQKVLSEAISFVAFQVAPADIRTRMLGIVVETNVLKSKIPAAKDQEYLDIKSKIEDNYNILSGLSESFTGFKPGSLDADIFVGSLREKYPESLNELTSLAQIVKLYTIHNQSILTDTKFLGFPFHYFYTAVFLLILFIVLCIVYNILIEWRLSKQGIVE